MQQYNIIILCLLERLLTILEKETRFAGRHK
jgi:hypothetical protein